MYEKHFFTPSNLVSERSLSSTSLWATCLKEICSMETIFFYSSLYDQKLSNGIEKVVSFWMAFVISKYLVHTMFLSQDHEGCCCRNFEMFPMPRCEWISNTKFMLFSAQIFMLVYVSSSLPPLAEKKINMYSRAYGLWNRINQILWSRSTSLLNIFFGREKWQKEVMKFLVWRGGRF